jgi:hypothetical protein
MKNFFLLFALCLSVITVNSQDCVFYCPVKEGTIMEIQHFNAKDKLQGTDKQTILSKQRNLNDLSVTVKCESYDDKNVLQYDKNLTYECKNGVFSFDMQNMLDPKTMAAYKDMQVSITATNLETPGKLTAGQTLKDGSLLMKVSNQGMTLMNMTTTIKNRKVEAIEKITTAAGTFECYKISYDIESKMMFTITGKGIDWISENIGVVRSESYDSKGKLLTYNVLSSLK